MENNEMMVTPVQNAPAMAGNRFSDEGFSLVADLTSAQLAYSSLDPQTDEEKAALYNATNNPEKRLADCINMTINMKNLYIEVVQCTNEETGEVTACPRVVILDEKNVGYQCVSVGVYSAIKKIVQIYGPVDMWTKPIKIMVKQITKGKKQMLTLNVVA